MNVIKMKPPELVEGNPEESINRLYSYIVTLQDEIDYLLSLLMEGKQ